ncbi:CPBP family intramembrane glutamic endopeptidase [Halobium salinum]|uniref:CPBP family intramembrane glutamic endopeptidase n=1 Tax=Halobium salinum TaxID=1364940 RepID=A0ABD5P890_9EURY|nr:type II CAAX endopeptidase family protein [Halobium salinum]
MASDSPTRSSTTDADGLGRHLQTLGAVVSVVAGAFIVAAVFVALGAGALRPLGLTQEDALGRVLISSFQFVGFILTAAAYFSLRDDWDLLGLRTPTARDLGWMAAGLVALVGLLFASSFVYELTALQPAESALVQFGQDQPAFFLYLVPMTLLLVGPAEELVFRGVVQGTLHREYGPWPGLVGASAIFALIHWSSYVGEGRVVTLATIFVLGGLLGYLYLRTENILVPAVAHGLFNAVQFLWEYASVTGLV